MKFFKRLFVVFLVFVCVIYFLSLREIPVLMYHFVGTPDQARENSLIVSQATFERHVAELKSWGYQALSLDEFYAVKTSGGSVPPGRRVVITFDDGNRDFYERVIPILERERISAANFLVWNNVKEKLQGSMSRKQIRELAPSPWATFGAHTIHHVELVDLEDEVMFEEISGAKKHLEKELGRPVYYFSYPSGFFSDPALEIVKKAGYRLAFTTSWKRLQGRSETLHSLTRIKITEKDRSAIRFWFKISGAHSILNRWRAFLLHGWESWLKP